MGTELVEAFADAAVQVLQEMLGTSVETGQRGGPALHTGDVTVLVGLTGSVSGVCLISMAEQTACAVAGAMMGESVSALDEIGRSAVSELGNMIAGAATIRLEERGIASDITPPSFVQGHPEAMAKLKGAQVPLNTDLGTISVAVSVRG